MDPKDPPSVISEFISQETFVARLLLQIKTAKLRTEPLPHTLLSGPDRMQLLTLAKLMAKEMGVGLREIDADAVLHPTDLAAILSNRQQGDFLVIGNVEQLNEYAIDILAPAMLDFKLDIVIGKGPAAKTMRLSLPRFTIVGLSSDPLQIDARLRQRFGLHYKFEPHDAAESRRTELSSFSEFIGQETIRSGLKLQIQAARLRKESLGHMLLSGPERIGKLTLAKLIAKEMGVNSRIIDGNVKLTGGRAVLTQLGPGDCLVIERPELLTGDAIQILVEAMESFSPDNVVGKGAEARRIRLALPRFTVIGISSQPRRIDNRLRHRFVFHYEFVPYNASEISQLIFLVVKDHDQTIVPAAANLLASFCSGTLDDINGLLKKVADYCLVKRQSRQIDYSGAISALTSFGYLDRPDSPAKIIDTLSGMKGTEFEEFVGELFSRIGYSIEFTPSTGDHGIDLFLKRQNEYIGVQCKRWTNPVGEPIIRDFYGSLLNSGAVNGIVITTTTFTQQAYSFAEKKPITLVGIDKLTDLIRRYYIKK